MISGTGDSIVNWPPKTGTELLQRQSPLFTDILFAHLGRIERMQEELLRRLVMIEESLEHPAKIELVLEHPDPNRIIPGKPTEEELRWAEQELEKLDRGEAIMRAIRSTGV